MHYREFFIKHPFMLIKHKSCSITIDNYLDSGLHKTAQYLLVLTHTA